MKDKTKYIFSIFFNFIGMILYFIPFTCRKEKFSYVVNRAKCGVAIKILKYFTSNGNPVVKYEYSKAFMFAAGEGFEWILIILSFAAFLSSFILACILYGNNDSDYHFKEKTAWIITSTLAIILCPIAFFVVYM